MKFANNFMTKKCDYQERKMSTTLTIAKTCSIFILIYHLVHLEKYK